MNREHVTPGLFFLAPSNANALPGMKPVCSKPCPTCGRFWLAMSHAASSLVSVSARHTYVGVFGNLYSRAIDCVSTLTFMHPSLLEQLAEGL
jgi:hypothetical protein